jgi:hypothetical protein
LLLENCQQVALGSNMLERNPLYGYTSEADNAVIFRRCRDCTLTGVQIHDVRNSPGLLLEECRRMNITGCTILDCEAGGLVLKNVVDSRISDCLVRDDREGAKSSAPLRVEVGRGNMIVNNLFAGEVQAEVAGNYLQNNYSGSTERP